MEFVPSPHEFEEEATPLIIEARSSPQKRSLSRVIEDVLGGLKSEGSELSEEVRKIAEEVDEVSQGRRLVEAQIH